MMHANNLPVPTFLPKPAETSQRFRFTKEEDDLLKKLAQSQSQPKWSEIARCFVNRTARQCRERYNNYLRPEILNGPWSPEEDILLIELFEKYGPKWALISQSFDARSAVNVKNHYSTISSQKKIKRNKVNKKIENTVNKKCETVVLNFPQIKMQEIKENPNYNNNSINLDYCIEDKTDFLLEEDNLENILSNIDISEDMWSFPDFVTSNQEGEFYIF